MGTFSADNLHRLLESLRGDDEAVSMIYSRLQSFEEYHKAIYESELCLKMRGFCDEYYALDKRRTVCHNGVLASVSLLNRLAKERGIPALYDGEISEAQPYRREVADAVLAFLESVILSRR